MMTWLRERGADVASTHICLESTGVYSEGCATAFADAGWKVSVVNPALPKDFGKSELKRNKTDAIDAGLLARYCSKMDPPAWQPGLSLQTRRVSRRACFLRRWQACKPPLPVNPNGTPLSRR